MDSTSVHSEDSNTSALSCCKVMLILAVLFFVHERTFSKAVSAELSQKI